MLKQFKKFKRLILTRTLKPKAFLILFALFFSSLAFAATLTVTLTDGRIPIHDTRIGGVAKCKNSAGEFNMDKDSTEDPYDVAFSTDGLQVFTANQLQEQDRFKGNLSMNRLMEPYDVSRSRINVLGNVDCNFIDSFRVGNLAGVGYRNNNSKLRNIVVADEGRKFFFVNNAGTIFRFDLSTPNEFSTGTFVNSVTPHAQVHGIAFSDDGTKLFTIRWTFETPLVTTYLLPNPYDISSITQTHQVDLTDIGVTLPTTDTNMGRDIEFSKSGLAMFVLIQNSDGKNDGTDDIYQFSLGKKFDVSTATLIGNYDVINLNTNTGLGHPIGFTFSNDGMRMFIVQVNGGAGVDQINSYQLDCPYGLVKCVSDTSASIESQVELAKQNISLNVNTIFKRFEWIKRNRDDENLTAHNFKINYEDPLMKSLANKFEPSVRNNVASFISKHKTENKKSKWSSWSLADISLSIFEKNGSANAKDINTRGLTLGADRKFGDNKFFGLALRYSDGSSDIKFSKQDLTMESLTLNLYGISPSLNDQYINAVLGFSHLRFNHRYMGNLSGERKGKQAFATINYRTLKKHSFLNLTPTGKLTYGVTRLSEFTDFLGKASGLPSEDIRYKEDTFVNGEFAGGFLFETDIIETDQGTLQPMGGLEIIYDLTDDVNYKYMKQGGTHVNKDTIHKHARKTLKYSLGFEAIHLNGFTVSADYQRTNRLNNNDNVTRQLPKIKTETFILKFSRSKEEDNQFALNYDPINAHQTNLSYSKNIYGLDFKINSNQSLENSSEYFTNLEVSGKF